MLDSHGVHLQRYLFPLCSKPQYLCSQRKLLLLCFPYPFSQGVQVVEMNCLALLLAPAFADDNSNTLKRSLLQYG